MLGEDLNQGTTHKEIWFKEAQKEEYERMLLLDAPEVKMVQDSDMDQISDNVEHF